eukprot:9134924-Pyramimonas_sp.AAC.1
MALCFLQAATSLLRVVPYKSAACLATSRPMIMSLFWTLHAKVSASLTRKTKATLGAAFFAASSAFMSVSAL